jgi:hypothetical protein
MTANRSSNAFSMSGLLSAWRTIAWDGPGGEPTVPRIKYLNFDNNAASASSFT